MFNYRMGMCRERAGFQSSIEKKEDWKGECMIHKKSKPKVPFYLRNRENEWYSVLVLLNFGAEMEWSTTTYLLKTGSILALPLLGFFEIRVQ